MADATELIKTKDFKEYLQNNFILYYYATYINAHTLLEKTNKKTKSTTNVIYTSHIP